MDLAVAKKEQKQFTKNNETVTQSIIKSHQK